MQRVLDPPMTTHGTSEYLRIPPQAVDVIAHLGMLFAAPFMGTNRHADRLQPTPEFPIGQVRWRVDLIVLAMLGAAVAFLILCMTADSDSSEVGFKEFGEAIHDRRVQVSLIAFQRQHEVSAAVDDVAGDVLLAARSINRNDCALHVYVIQKLRNRRDFVRFLLGCQLTQHDATLGGPGTYDVQRTESSPTVMRTTHRLAIDRHDWPVGFASTSECRLQPEGETLLECLRL